MARNQHPDYFHSIRPENDINESIERYRPITQPFTDLAAFIPVNLTLFEGKPAGPGLSVRDRSATPPMYANAGELITLIAICCRRGGHADCSGMPWPFSTS